MDKYPWIKSYPKGMEWENTIAAKPLHHILDDAVTSFPEHTAIDFLGKTYSYGRLQALVNRAACGLRKLGVKKGVKVGLLLPNCPQFVIAFFAILKAGGTVVNFSPLASRREIKNQIEDSGTEIMFTLNLTACYPKLEGLINTTSLRMVVVGQFERVLPIVKRVLFTTFKSRQMARIPDDPHHVKWQELLAYHDEEFEAGKININKDIAVLQYTGGTTGVPKAAMLSHANLYANVKQAEIWCASLEKGKERVLGVLPLFHSFAMSTVMNLGITLGATLILHPRFDLKSVLKDIRKKKPTLLPGVPTMFTALSHHREIRRYKLNSLKLCISGGAGLPLETRNQFENATGCKLVEGYGLTEASPFVCCNPIGGKNKEGSIGLPLPNTIVRIEDMENRGKFLGTGKKGELCVKGPQVMKGYFNQQQESENVLKNGLLRTGDVAYIDDEGYVFIADRLKEMILTGGFNVYPRVVEEVLYEHEAVLEAAVIGIKDGKYGQIVKAFVVLKEGKMASEHELIDYCKGELAKYEIPRSIEFRETLPKTMIGKISKKDLLRKDIEKRFE